MITHKISYWLIAILAITLASCEKDTSNRMEVTQTGRNSKVEGKTVENPYSLRVMQAVLDSLISTKSETSDNHIELEPTDYYIRICSIDTTAVQILSTLDVELFDYPLDCEFEDDTEYYFDPEEPIEEDSGWFYTAVPVEYAIEDIPYENVIEAQESGSYIEIELETNERDTISCELIDACYIPEHNLTTKTGSKLPVSPEELESMAYKIAGIQQDDYTTKASSSYPSGYVYLNDGSSDIPVKGVKIRAQKFVKWRTTYTNAAGYFHISKQFTKPNISIIYNNTKDYIIWGNWLFLSPATYTKHNCTRANSFSKTFSRSDEYSPWTWAVVNNATFDYYNNCSNTGLLKDVSLPPANMKLWCLNVNLGNVGGGAPMIKHLVTSRVLSGSTAILSYLTSIHWIATTITVAVAALINVMGPDILLNTHNKTYDELYATTFHELSHASHFSSIGEWNYGKLIWHEMTHGDKNNLYGKGDTGTDGEGYCEVSETYAFSIENFVRDSILTTPKRVGQSSYYFFGKYVTVLSNLLINETLTPGEIYSCMGSDMKSMSVLMQKLCEKYPTKETDILTEMTAQGL